MEKWEYERVMSEVDTMLSLNYHKDVVDPKKLSPKAYEMYMLLTTKIEKPIRLSLFIYGYQDSDNLDDDFSLDNDRLHSFLNYDIHEYITIKLKFQLAYYYCIKHIDYCLLYLCYLELITDREHRSIGTNVPYLKKCDILGDLDLMEDLRKSGCNKMLAVMKCKLAGKIAQEYFEEIDEFTSD